jgi:hypothetical protein
MNSSHKSAAILVPFIGIREANLPVILNSKSVPNWGRGSKFNCHSCQWSYSVVREFLDSSSNSKSCWITFQNDAVLSGSATFAIASKQSFIISASLKVSYFCVKFQKPCNEHTLQYLIIRLNFWTNFATEQDGSEAELFCPLLTGPVCSPLQLWYMFCLILTRTIEIFSLQIMQTVAPLIQVMKYPSVVLQNV